ncbi:choline dehydrogenase, partial [Colletotrichum higginsianum]
PCRLGSEICKEEDQKAFFQAQTYLHHITGSCAIRADDNPIAVLDSQFRVWNVDGLHVVDGSVFPAQPGEVTSLATFMISE